MKSFTVIAPEVNMPVVLNIPHSSGFIPEALKGDFVLAQHELAEEQRRIVDWFTDELYAPFIQAGASAVINNVSRLVVDPERFEDDSLEVMAKRGIGVIYEKTTDLQQLREKPTPEEREELLSKYYRPYHRALSDLTTRSLEKFGRCLVLDCHSFPEHCLPYELDPEAERPGICVGTDKHHTSASLVELVRRSAQQFGYSFGIDTPFAGTIVPLQYYRDSRVSSVMLEVNRALYMDEVTTSKNEKFGVAREWVATVAAELCSSDSMRVS